MKLFDWRWLVVSSVLVVAVTATAESRPQYGGTLHVAMRAAPTSLDPADGTQMDSFARRSLTMLMFDTLVTIDENGRVQASLAVSWQTSATSANNQRWQLRLRQGSEVSRRYPAHGRGRSGVAAGSESIVECNRGCGFRSDRQV